MDTPMVSITVCVRDGASWIQGCLEALLTQNYPSFEILAVNDGSMDGAEAIMDAYHDPEGLRGHRFGFTTNPRSASLRVVNGRLNRLEENGWPSRTSTFVLKGIGLPT